MSSLQTHRGDNQLEQMQRWVRQRLAITLRLELRRPREGDINADTVTQDFTSCRT